VIAGSPPAAGAPSAARPFEPPAADAAFRILAIDGGGIRGLIPARVLRHLEARIGAQGGEATLATQFDLIAGTSTGGLIALALTAPAARGRARMSAADLVELYEGADARAIFRRPLIRRLPVLGRAIDLVLPKYGLGPLEEVLRRRLGEATMAETLGDVLVTAYDMTNREPRFFKRWNRAAPTISIVDAALATAAAPTFFPPHELGAAALIDGGVFASNPTVAAIAEALKRTERPAALGPHDLLVVSLGTGHHEISYAPPATRRWGAADWILPRRDGDPPLIAAMLDGQSDAADHWAHVLLNHVPGTELPPRERLGSGPRYYRYQLELPGPLPLDDPSASSIAVLGERADALIEARADELEALARTLAR
jgi:predicted acylesterase/phospholipase RssA